MLAVENLAAGYGGREVIGGITLEVGAGEIVALIGANGAGKSTLARVLSGLQPAYRGTVRFNGADITGASAAARVRDGLLHVPEGRQVFTGLTVAQNLAMGAYTHAAGPRTAEQLRSVYARFPVLEERAAAYAGNLSGGQQQMLAIGRALMGRPRLLVLDEPSLGLSPALVAEVFALVRDLRGSGLAILLSEQNARMSLAVADRAYVLENGRVTLSGPAAELARSPDIAARYLGVGGAENRIDDGLTARLVGAIRQAGAGEGKHA
jgi:branched-chain amino acid transport system ATP-binding protein